MLIVNQAGDRIYNVDHIKEIVLDKGAIYIGDSDKMLKQIYFEQLIPARVIFEAIIEAAATGATLIRLDKNI